MWKLLLILSVGAFPLRVPEDGIRVFGGQSCREYLCPASVEALAAARIDCVQSAKGVYLCSNGERAKVKVRCFYNGLFWACPNPEDKRRSEGIQRNYEEGSLDRLQRLSFNAQGV